jgi:serine/threonine-protein kinase RsbT
LSEIQWRLVATAVSELARNIVKYAEHGSVRVREVRSRGRRGIEVVVEDIGPGIADVDKAMQDAYSTAGTLGLGLPGVKRMMDEFELASMPGEGLRVVARKWV